jgi:hypothetical protein
VSDIKKYHKGRKKMKKNVLCVLMFLIVGLVSFSCQSNKDKEYKILDYSINTSQVLVPTRTSGHALEYNGKILLTPEVYYIVSSTQVKRKLDDNYEKVNCILWNTVTKFTILSSDHPSSTITKDSGTYYAYFDDNTYEESTDVFYSDIRASQNPTSGGITYNINHKYYTHEITVFKYVSSSDSNIFGYTNENITNGSSRYIYNLTLYNNKMWNDSYGFYKFGNTGEVSDFSAVHHGFYYINGNEWRESNISQYYEPKSIFLKYNITIESKTLFGNYKVLNYGVEEPVYKVKFSNDFNYYLVLGVSL